MALILNIETTTTNCSVSLSKEGETLVLKEDYNSNYSHAETLHVFIADVLKEAALKKEDLDAVGVSKGPGSYTGLRIGVSAAKGLCFALDIPLISVSTLEALSHQVDAKRGVVIPMLDARRMEVYSAVFNSSFEIQREIQAEVLDDDSYSEWLHQGQVYFVGNGVEKTKEIVTHENAIFKEGVLPSASTMGRISEKKFKTNNFEDVAYFEPYYLKDFVALKSKKPNF
ncbi:MAG: tRNA (adenosine(37)-N6)-threonylcarbamoyltransferase complex dimerization subunit type 1 TsaB [Bacteroidetes bacterium MedPE-SWsnd-G2]|nr:MAG: tRNA (adenosine(37)-N6)-threonylcarbamoyltransferase complex dimerization subunit type 1 TsaB [Bacteroidetes bacterium MedPE-SWsnd-G2]